MRQFALSKQDRVMSQIRTFQQEDAAAISHIIRTTMRVSNTVDYPIEQLQPLMDYFSPEKLIQLNRERRCLVAEENGTVVGTAALEGCELVTFFILPEHQGRGIGAALLTALEAIAQAQDQTHLIVHASMTGSGFYERRGYLRTGDVIDGTAGPQISMQKHLH
jgi:N-acetylglutamate synthase-like GNAT family acetyltransferase